MVTRIINGIELDIDETLSNELYFTQAFIDQIPDFKGDTTQIKEGLYNAGGNGEYLPVSVMWELTNYCTFSCPFCYINTPNAQRHAFYSLDELKKLADSLIAMGMLFCTLSGGECLMHPNFIELYTYLKERGVIVSVFTNGLLINDELIEIFKKYRPYKVEISIYGITSDGFKKATKTNYNYETVLENILKLKKIGIDVRCKTPITNLTSKDIPLIQQWCDEHDIHYYVSEELFDSYYGDNVDNFRTQDTVYQTALKHRTANFIKHSDHKFGRKIAWNCSAGKYTGVVSADRCFYPCMSSVGIEQYKYPINDSIESAIAQFRTTLSREKGQLLAFCKGCKSCNVCEKCVLSAIKDSDRQRSAYCMEMQQYADQ